MKTETLISWPVSSTFGWGIRGLGYFLNWPGMIGSSSAELTAELPPNDPRWPLLRERMARSRDWQRQFLSQSNPSIVIGDAVLVPLGNGFDRFLVAFGRDLKGKPTIACPVFEDVELAKANAHKLREYDVVVVASEWNRNVLAELDVESVVCHEGIDPQIFNPSVKQKRSDGRFRVFSGGKTEYRKGQDLVIEAFKVFAEKYDDAVLVAAWSSPFGGLAGDLAATSVGAPPGYHIGKPNFHAWLQRNGLRSDQFEIVPPLPNWRMAEVYGSCDVALFPNRLEGGTNFVAMECIACGVPTAIRLSYGMDDLCGTGEVFNYDGATDESSVVEWLVDAMDETYEAPLWLGCGGVGRGEGTYWTWERHCKQMAEIIDGI